MSIGEDEIGPAIIVEVQKHGTPTQVLRMLAESRGEGYIRKNSIPIVAVEGWGVIGKVGLKNVQAAVAIVIGDSRAHSGLLATVFVECNSSHDGNICEAAVMIVVIEDARGAVGC